MSTNRKHRKHQHLNIFDSKKRSARITRRILVLSIGILLVILAGLIFKFLGSYWPAWLVENRTLFIGILAFLAIFLGLLSPLLVEVNRNFRSLSGPGDNPEYQNPYSIKK